MPHKLLYIMDFHCAWSYANQKAILDLSNLLKKEYRITILPGGMWDKNHSIRGGKAIKDYLLPTIVRINENHNGAISQHYIDLIQDSSYLFSSEIASKAILAMNEVCPEKSIAFAGQLMNNQFEKGMRYDVEKTYNDALSDLQIDHEEFKKKWKDQSMIEIMRETFKTAKLLTSRYPALFLMKDGAYHLIKRGSFNSAEILKELRTATIITSNSQ